MRWLSPLLLILPIIASPAATSPPPTTSPRLDAWLANYCRGAVHPDVPITVPALPAGYHRVQVQLMVRHGDRTPLRSLPPNLPSSPKGTWACPDQLTLARAGGASGNGARLFAKVYEDAQEVIPATSCALGQLTDIGVRQQRSIGIGLRRAFVRPEEDPANPNPGNASGPYLLSADGLSADEVYARATDYPRTQQSIQALLLALSPPPAGETVCPSTAEGFTIHTVEKEADTLFGNVHTCPFLPTNEASVLLQSKEWSLDRSVSAADKATISEAFGESGSTEDQGRDWLFQHIDTLAHMDCHMSVFPPSLTPDLRMLLYELADLRWAVVASDTDHALMSMSTFVLDVLHSSFLDAVNSTSGTGTAASPALRVYGAHDASVAPLLTALGVNVSGWPPLASQVLVELLEPGQDLSGRVIRLSYNGEPQMMAGCGGEILCPWAVWLEKMKSIHKAQARLAGRCHVQVQKPSCGYRYLTNNTLVTILTVLVVVLLIAVGLLVCRIRWMGLNVMFSPVGSDEEDSLPLS